MKQLHPLAIEIFAAAKASRPNTVFLCDGPENTVLSFGPCCTSTFRYRIALNSNGTPFELSSNDHSPISIFLDQQKDGIVRLVIYTSDRDPIHFDGATDAPNSLVGHVFIEAHETNGPGLAVIHAAFAGKEGTSLLIDSSPQLLRHLDITTRTLSEREGGNNLVELFQSTGTFGLES